MALSSTVEESRKTTTTITFRVRPSDAVAEANVSQGVTGIDGQPVKAELDLVSGDILLSVEKRGE